MAEEAKRIEWTRQRVEHQEEVYRQPVYLACSKSRQVQAKQVDHIKA